MGSETITLGLPDYLASTAGTGLAFYNSLKSELDAEKCETSEQLRALILDVASEMGISDFHHMALWKGLSPVTGEPCNWLKLRNLNLVLSNSDVALLRWLLLRFDETELVSINREAERARVKDKDRFSILARDKFMCQKCGRSPDVHGVALKVDHIIPVSKGGKTHPGNLITLCDDCNSGKGATLYPELIKMEYLLSPPPSAYFRGYTPPNDYEINSGQVLIRDGEWKDHSGFLREASRRFLSFLGATIITLGEFIQLKTTES